MTHSQKITAGKSGVFRKRTVDAITEPTTADTAIDGLHLSLAMRELVEEYLLGNVREKIAQVQETVNRITLTNLQPLMKMYRDFADIKMPEDLPHLTRPKLKNDSRTVVQIEPSRAFKKIPR